MVAVVAVGPAVEAAGLHRGQIVGHQIATELVALVDDRPERSGARLEVDADRIAQARGEQTRRAVGRVDLQDRRAARLGVDAVLAVIAVRADRDEKRPAVRAGDESLGPVVVDLAGGQCGHLGARVGNLRLAGAVGKAKQGIGVGDVEVVADQRHAEGRRQPGQEDGSGLGDAVAIGVAQQQRCDRGLAPRRRRCPGSASSRRRGEIWAGLAARSISATSTSPSGSTSSHRGWSRPRAKAVTRRPAAGVGASSAAQPSCRRDGDGWDGALGRRRQRGSRADAGCGRQVRVVGTAEEEACGEIRRRCNDSAHHPTSIQHPDALTLQAPHTTTPPAADYSPSLWQCLTGSHPCRIVAAGELLRFASSCAKSRRTALRPAERIGRVGWDQTRALTTRTRRTETGFLGQWRGRPAAREAWADAASHPVGDGPTKGMADVFEGRFLHQEVRGSSD